jgi:formylglycine-generating enzyme required for sulfatase activity
MRQKESETTRKIDAFNRRFGIPHLYLAYHAAFPLSLTPDLLSRIWANFKEDSGGKPLHISYHAVTDVLIGLCEEVGYGLYEMEPETRAELLRRLQADPRLGKSRIEALAAFLLRYSQSLHESEDEDEKALARVQRWAALAYTDIETATGDIARVFADIAGNTAELVRMESIVLALAVPLGKESPLSRYARGMGSYGRGDIGKATESLLDISPWGETLQVAGVHLPIPERVRNSREWQRRRLLKYAFLVLLGCFGVVGAYFLYRKMILKLKVFRCSIVTVDAKGQEISRETKRIRYFVEKLPQEVELKMVYIPRGQFWMGTEEAEIARLNKKYGQGYSSSESPRHEVSVPAFFMGKYEVTQAQWKAIASLPQIDRDLKSDPSNFKGDNRPVERVSWLDAVEFCKRLSRKTGKEYRLPSEAEWEYACRAGTTTPFAFGETLTGRLANYDATSTYAEEPKDQYRQQTTPVGKFPPNAFGLYDTHGNVWEWCEDDWHDNYQGAPKDGTTWIDNDNRSQSLKCLRGGSWSYYPYSCRSANRIRYFPDLSISGGFRVACVSPGL